MALGNQLRKARLARKLTTSEIAATTRIKVQIVEALEQEDFGKMAAPIYGKGFIRLYAEYVGLDPDPLVAEYLSKVSSAKPPSLVVDDGDGNVPDPAPPQKPVQKPVQKTATKEDAAEPTPPPPPEPDLFSLAEQTESKQPTPPTRPPRPKRPPISDAVKGWWASLDFSGIRTSAERVRTQCANATKQVVEACAARASRFRQAVQPPPQNVRETDTPEAPAPWQKLAPAAIGIVVIVVLLIMGLSRALRRGAAADPTDTGPDILRLAEAPPPPYID